MRRTTKALSMVAGVGAGVMAVIWLLRDRLMGPEAMPPPPRHPAFRVVPSGTPPPGESDHDLTAITGIGPAYRARLVAAGIGRFSDLAASEPAAVAEAAGVSEARAGDWIAQARELAG
jgi:predicted flap endonuclease-1-like 5' DNA nuclease